MQELAFGTLNRSKTVIATTDFCPESSAIKKESSIATCKSEHFMKHLYEIHSELLKACTKANIDNNMKNKLNLYIHV